MYEHEGLKDFLFIMLYGGVAMMAVLAGMYLWFRAGNAVEHDVESPSMLRRWASAFMTSVAASHVWWVVLGIYWLTDDRLLRNIVAITLDRITFVPLMMCMLLRMLQDRRRPLWPIAVAMTPLVVVAVISIVTRCNDFEWFTEGYSLLIGISFIIYYVRALRQYDRWLRENFADLEHKEVWQSLVLLACILLVYVAYTTNEGALATECLAQVLTIVIIGFVVWRVETLQRLEVGIQGDEMMDADVFPIQGRGDTVQTTGASGGSDIPALLYTHCEQEKLYLQHDLTLNQLAVVLGTNRTYLGNHFAAVGESYNTYISRLRIDHFCRLYCEAQAEGHAVTAAQLSMQSGYRSYRTFSAAFKQRMGKTVTEWMRDCQ